VDAHRNAKALPKDPSVQLELAQAAQGANDAATAIAAYDAFPAGRTTLPESAC
jgi:hypothetical protein